MRRGQIASPSQSSQQTLTYSPASQLVTLQQANANYVWTGQPTTTRSSTRDGLNRDAAIAAMPGGYDARGNLTSDGQRTFAYDVENRLISSSGGGAAMSLSYDPLGRLFEVVSAGATTQFLYDGDRRVAEFDGAATSPLRRYVHGAGVDEPVVWYEGPGTGGRRWLHSDRQGSITAWTDSLAAITVYTYGPYGEPQDWQGSRFRYTGQVALPEAQLHHKQGATSIAATGEVSAEEAAGLSRQATTVIEGLVTAGTEGAKVHKDQVPK